MHATTIPASAQACLRQGLIPWALLLLCLMAAAPAPAAPTVASLTLSPPGSTGKVGTSSLTVQGGANVTGKVEMSGLTAADSLQVQLASSDSRSAPVPASVTLTATPGDPSRAAGTFTFTVAQVSATTQVTISTGGKQATLTINPRAGLASLSVSPATVAGGAAATGTVTLTADATNALTVELASSNTAAVTVPASVTIAAGQRTATFAVSTSQAGSSTPVTLSAGLGQVKKTATLAVDPPPPALSTLTVSPVSVQAGATASGTVTLSAAAPASGATVTLSSSRTEATVPSSVTVAAGATSAQFTVQANTTSSTVQAMISATLGSAAAKTAQLIVNPAVLVVSSLALDPASVQGGRPVLGTVTLSAAAPSGGTTVTLASTSAEATVPATALVTAGSTSASFNIATGNPASDASATISAKVGSTTAKTAQLAVISTAASIASVSLSPSTVQPGATSIATINLTAAAPAGGVTLNLVSNSADAPVPATVSIGAGASRATFEIPTRAASAGGLSATISAALGASAAKTAKLYIEAPPVQANSVHTLTISPTSVQGGESAVATVTLTRAAPKGGETVNLVSTSAEAPVIPSIAVAEGSTTATFSIHTQISGTTAVEATIAAAVGSGGDKTAKLTVRPVPVEVSSIALSPASIRGGETATATVTLAGSAPEGGARIALRSSDGKATVPAFVTLNAGATSAQFSIGSSEVTAPVAVTLSAEGTTGGARTAQLTIQPPPPSVTALALSPATVEAGATATGTVTLSAPAPADGATIALASSLAAATVPATVMVASGATSAQFTIQAGSPEQAATATLSAAATGNASPVAAQLTVNAAAATPSNLAEQRAGSYDLSPVRQLAPSIASADVGPTPQFVKGGLLVRLNRVRTDREARIASVASPGACKFITAESVSFPWPLPSTATGEPGLGGAAIVGTFTAGGAVTRNVDCNLAITYEWRDWDQDANAWEETWHRNTEHVIFVIPAHETVTVSDTWRLRDWLDATSDRLGIGNCADGIRSHNGKLSFYVEATALGADCPYAVMSDKVHDRTADPFRNWRLLPEGVVLSSMVWKVETHGSGCCLGTSKNQACADLPQPPATYQFEIMAGMNPSQTNGAAYSVFSKQESIIDPGTGFEIAGNPQKNWRTAVKEVYGRLSCPAVNPVTVSWTGAGDALCDASCSALSGFGLAALVPSRTGLGNGGELRYTSEWQGECRIEDGPMHGQCRADTACVGGPDYKYDENGVWKCRTQTLTPTDMPWVRVTLDSITVLRPSGTVLPW